MLGPEELSYSEIAAIVSETLGRGVRYEHQSYETYRQAAINRGFTEAFAQGFVDMLRAKEEGMDNVASRATAIIGQTSFRQWAEEVLKPAILG